MPYLSGKRICMNKRYVSMMLAGVMMLSGCDSENVSDSKNMNTYQWSFDQRTVYVYMPEDIQKDEQLPLVLDMNCTGGDPESEVTSNGWDKEAEKERFIVVAPEYNDAATYSEVDYMMEVVDEAVKRYPVDEERIYATGFSNGGALAVALASEHPERFAAISAAGWMVGMNHINTAYNMPFQLLQGTNEFTETDTDGNKEIMSDEREALEDLFTMNGMNEPVDYAKTSYWGYRPDRSYVMYPEYTDYDIHGENPEKKSGISWTVNEYYKDGYQYPFAQLILIEQAEHVMHSNHAELAWDFFRHFQRGSDGKIIES